MAQEAGKELISRLAWMRMAPLQVIDMGCGPGEMSVLLKQRYPQANVIALDIAESMLRHVGRENNMASRLCADASLLPFKDNSIDLIFANLLLPWCHDVASLLQEWQRVLKAEGLLMFTAFGLETAKELTNIPTDQLALRVDIHDYGDLLMQAGFADPVLDVDQYILSYKNSETLLQELRTSLIWFPSEQEMKEVFSKHQDSPLEVTYEMIFAHAFAREVKKQKEIKIPFEQVRRQLFSNKT